MTQRVIVAETTSRFGGECEDDSSHMIQAGEKIFKISDIGPTTGPGNGPGYWVCEDCSGAYEWKKPAA